MTKKVYTEKYSHMAGKTLFLIVLAGMLIGMTACSGKETVLLEAEDIVRTEKADVFLGGVQGSVKEDLTEGDSADLSEMQEQVEESTLFIHICGEVERPGVYELPVGSRIYEAVEEAGGFTEEAAEDHLNLAYRLEDGWKIEIPAKKRVQTEDPGQEQEAAKSGDSAERNSQAAEYKAAVITGIAPGVLSGAETVTAAGEADDGLVDINTAAKEELLTLPGVGESRAAGIISYREKNGGFSRIEDIMKVEGIKEGMFEKMKDRICVRGVR